MSFFRPDKKEPKVDVIKEALPTFYISKEALTKMQLYVEGCSDEIGWLGTVEQSGKEFLITDVMLFEQEVHSTTTEITPEGLSSFGEEILKEENGVELWNSIKVWGHSHVNMSVFASGQDDDQMITFKDCGHDWFVRIIANKKGDMKLDLYMYNEGIVYQDLPFTELLSVEEYKMQKEIQKLEDELNKLQISYKEQLKEDVDKDIKDKVSKKTYKSTKTKGQTSVYDVNRYKNYKKKGEEGRNASKYYYEDEYFGYGYGYKDYVEETEGVTVQGGFTDEEKSQIHKDNLDMGLDSVWFMQGLALCEDEDEAREELAMWGFIDIYSDDDIIALWDNAMYTEGGGV